MNAQLRPILDLLREVESINLSSDVLEPEPSSIHQVLYCGTEYSYKNEKHLKNEQRSRDAAAKKELIQVE